MTLVGPGGVGKTRLAMEAGRAVAERFPGGAVHVDLDGVEDAGVLVPEAATALGVVATSAPELAEQLRRVTRGAPALLVLDGFERFIEDAEQVGRLLAEVANLTVLATSRAPLRITSEHLYWVDPLTGPDAAALLGARVRAARANWELEEEGDIIAAICARLDGLPLAIELAADRARLLTPRALLERLEHRLELLTGGPRDLPARQRSLRATLEWSWEALGEPEQTLLGRLTLFEGGASLDAAAAVFNGVSGDASVVGSLVDSSSLLRSDSGRDAEPRFRMLDTVREFAAERAAEHEDLEALGLRHARYFLAYAEHAAEQAARTDRREWLDRLARERGNIRVAFERLLRIGAVDEALRLAIAFARALPWDAHAHEVRGWLAQSLAAETPLSPARRAAALYWDGMLALSQGRYTDAEARLRAAAEGAREAGDPAVEAGRAGRAWAAAPSSSTIRTAPASATKPWLRRTAPARRSWSPTRCWPRRARTSAPTTGSGRSSSSERRSSASGRSVIRTAPPPRWPNRAGTTWCTAVWMPPSSACSRRSSFGAVTATTGVSSSP